MKSIVFPIGFALFLAIPHGINSLSAATPVKIHVVAFGGKVTIEDSGDKSITPSAGVEIPIGGKISTGATGWVDLSQGGLATLRVKSKTETFEIKESSWDPSTKLSSSAFKLKNGAVFVRTNKDALTEGSKYQVQMPELTANLAGAGSQGEMVSWAKGSAILNVQGHIKGARVGAQGVEDPTKVDDSIVVQKAVRIPKILDTPKTVEQKIKATIATSPILDGGTPVVDAKTGKQKGEAPLEDVSASIPVKMRVVGFGGSATLKDPLNQSVTMSKGATFPMNSKVSAGTSDWIDLAGSTIINIKNHITGSMVPPNGNEEPIDPNEKEFVLKGDQLPDLIQTSNEVQQRVRATIAAVADLNRGAADAGSGPHRGPLEDVTGKAPVKIRAIAFSSGVTIIDPDGKSIIPVKGVLIPIGSKFSLGPTDWIDVAGSAIINIRDHIAGATDQPTELAQPIDVNETMVVVKGDEIPGIIQTPKNVQDRLDATALSMPGPIGDPVGGGVDGGTSGAEIPSDPSTTMVLADGGSELFGSPVDEPPLISPPGPPRVDVNRLATIVTLPPLSPLPPSSPSGP